jgi:hypothetical protein
LAIDLFPNADLCGQEMFVEELPFEVDDVLQDVVIFPHGYTTNQKQEAELLKLIHYMGAPNGVFQSIMSWAKTALAAGYDFQPSPLAYDWQIIHFEKLVGMTACRPFCILVLTCIAQISWLKTPLMWLCLIF